MGYILYPTLRALPLLAYTSAPAPVWQDAEHCSARGARDDRRSSLGHQRSQTSRQDASSAERTEVEAKLRLNGVHPVPHPSGAPFARVHLRSCSGVAGRGALLQEGARRSGAAGGESLIRQPSTGWHGCQPWGSLEAYGRGRTPPPTLESKRCQPWAISEVGRCGRMPPKIKQAKQHAAAAGCSLPLWSHCFAAGARYAQPTNPGGPSQLFKFFRAGSLRAGHARPLRELISAFVGAGHALPAFNDLEDCSGVPAIDRDCAGCHMPVR